MNKKDPYPITDVYHIANILVDGATVTVTDLCENLSNSFDTDTYGIEEEIKKITVDPRDNFLEKCKNKDKSIRSEYSLNEKDKAIYDKLDKEIKFGNFHYYERTWNNQSISKILKERNKKNK